MRLTMYHLFIIYILIFNKEQEEQTKAVHKIILHYKDLRRAMSTKMQILAFCFLQRWQYNFLK